MRNGTFRVPAWLAPLRFDVLSFSAIRRPKTPRSAPANRATWTPATTPAAPALAVVGPVGGGSKTFAMVRSTTRPTGNPILKDVLTIPEASPSSPCFVPATAAMFTAEKPVLAPSAHTTKPCSVER